MIHFRKGRRLGILAAALILASCSHQSAVPRDSAGLVVAGENNQVSLVFFSSARCFTQPFGCSLGGQQGGVDIQSKLIKDRSKVAATMAFWAGATFTCLPGLVSENPELMADVLQRVPLAFVAPSGEDLKLPLKRLRALKKTIGKPWVVSNYVGEAKDLPWVPFLDVTVGEGKFRVFNFTYSAPKTGKAPKHNLSSDMAAVTKALSETPADRVNLVIVASKSHDFFLDIVNQPKAHLVFETEGRIGETVAPQILPWDRALSSVRPHGQAAMVLNVKVEPTFKGFYYPPVADIVRIGRNMGQLESEDHLSSEKVPGLWELDGEMAIMANP